LLLIVILNKRCTIPFFPLEIHESNNIEVSLFFMREPTHLNALVFTAHEKLKVTRFEGDTTVWVARRQRAQAPTPQAPIRNRQTRKVANAKGLNRNANLT